MKCFVIIKADKVSTAILAANQRGIILSQDSIEVHPTPYGGQVRAYARPYDADAIRKWFHETNVGNCPEGACLWFAEPRDFGQQSKTVR